MKNRKTLKKLSVCLLAAMMMISLVPGISASETDSEFVSGKIYVGGVGLSDGQYLDASGNISDTQPADGYAYYKDNVLTLNNYTYTGKGHLYSYQITDGNGETETLYNTSAIVSKDIYTLVLVGENSLTNTTDDTDLYYGDALSCLDNLTITGDGSLVLTADYGISCQKNVTIESNMITINAHSDGIYLINDFTFNGELLMINADFDGIYSHEGSITARGGILDIQSENSGLNAYTEVVLEDGTVNIVSKGQDGRGIYTYESNIHIKDSTVSVTSAYDGIYAKSGTVNIAGGNIAISMANGISVTGTAISVNAGNIGIFAGNDIAISDALTMSSPKGGQIKQTDSGKLIADAEGAPATDIEIKPLAYTITLMDSLGFDMAIPIIPGQSFNQSYAEHDMDFILNSEHSGYTFEGWYLDYETYENQYSFDTAVNADIVLYAKWTPNTYTVRFDSGGGDGEMESQSFLYGQEQALSKNEYYRKGSGFAGWASEPDGNVVYADGELVKNLTEAKDGSITLYAKWQRNAGVSGGGNYGTSPSAPKDENEDEEEEEPSVTEPPKEELPEETKPNFADVPAGHWAENAVSFVFENGLMNGTSDEEFAPDETVTRAMLVTILYRAEGEPEAKAEAAFADVAPGSYYEDAVLWAQANGIVTGLSETEFAPDSTVTREQIAAILFRYAAYKGYDVSVGGNTNILSYEDASDISEYAISAMQYTVGSGLMKSKSASTLNPKDNATRAEIAAIIYRLMSLAQ